MSDGSRMKATVVSLTKKKGISWGMADLRTIWRMLAGSFHRISPPTHHLLLRGLRLLGLAGSKGRAGHGRWADSGGRAESGPGEGTEEAGVHGGLSGLRVSALRGRANSREGAGGAGGGRTGLGLRRPWRWFVMVVRVGARRRVAGDAGKSSKAGHVTGLARSTERGPGPELTQGLGRHRP
jgi:hypothetical protein